ncbi:MAG TPA: MBOAT family O-acyltransferase [Cyclobacteriaceae bacterium]|nr:MBOAT family O-acyltransferase [Cyclobacteriaceae bacterium]
MIFNSYEYVVFFVLVFLIYWFVVNKNLRLQNLFLLAASYLFYGWWDWRFLFLLIFSTLLDFFTGQMIHQSTTQSRKKMWLVISVGVNLGFLGFFKYYNFFAHSFADMLGSMGIQANPASLSLILPIGISFYTFHGLSYVLDIYNGRCKPTNNPIDYSVFVGFFPLLVAGPIERASHLLPQVQQPRIFSPAQATDGLRQILWGVFKKIAIADICAPQVNEIFATYQSQPASVLLLGAVLFAFQIYGDFSGYSDIALGSARLLGFDLLRNFAFPYFSRDIAEFWRRWHISLSSWFKDYLYIPLGGSRGSRWVAARNTMIIFVVSGFWHGANWTFIAWGFLNGLYFLPLLLATRNRTNIGIVAEGRLLPSLSDLLHMGLTFLLVLVGWIFFRATNISHALGYLGGMTHFDNLWPIPIQYLRPLLFISIMLVVEWFQRTKQHGLEFDQFASRPVRWAIYFLIILLTLNYFQQNQQFIYFQF